IDAEVFVLAGELFDMFDQLMIAAQRRRIGLLRESVSVTNLVGASGVSSGRKIVCDRLPHRSGAPCCANGGEVGLVPFEKRIWVAGKSSISRRLFEQRGSAGRGHNLCRVVSADDQVALDQAVERLYLLEH